MRPTYGVDDLLLVLLNPKWDLEGVEIDEHVGLNWVLV
ncbi:hypothetical protein T07_2360 [Trichinella nelsoni]|uniref:Uncharacterized protein n=1 Tax=Trichinella nelsoni TaxID=6336 RepID=A0A0V0RB10_9BILA|nr:hypothetical protein T07_2360 [Trichinella nelsoni]